MGTVYENILNDFQNASIWYQKATKYDPSYTKAMLSLAKVHSRMGDFAAAQTQLTAVLKTDNDSEEASMILAQLLCQQNSFSTAAFHYRQIVEKSPSNYGALSQYIDVSRRIDKLDDVESLFKHIDLTSPRSKMNPGYIYCQGIYLRYYIS